MNKNESTSKKATTAAAKVSSKSSKAAKTAVVDVLTQVKNKKK